MENRWKEFRKEHTLAIAKGLEEGKPNSLEEIQVTLLINIATELRVVSEQLEELLQEVKNGER